jgi:hemolysin activation/secretion protein
LFAVFPIGFLWCFVARLALLPLIGLPGYAFASEYEKLTIDVAEYLVVGDNPLDERRTQALLKPFVGPDREVKSLQNAAKMLQDAIHQRGLTFVRVVLPRQRLESGTITLRVVHFSLTGVTVQGNEHFEDKQILASLPQLRFGESPNTRALSKALSVVRQHPSRKQKVTFSAANAPRTISARVQVDDRDPVSVFTWLNNTGSKRNGRYRLGLGFQHADMFDRDHSTTLTYTTSPTDVQAVSQYGVVYRMPLYQYGGMASVFLAESSSDSGRVAEFFEVAGRGSIGGAQYTQFFPRREGYSPMLNVSLTDKGFDNDVTFAGTPIGVDIRSRPLALRYSADLKRQKQTAHFYVEYMRNVTSGSNNNRQAYEASRNGAKPAWSALRFGAGFERALPNDWSMVGNLGGQYTSDPLIAGEQLGLGGAASIRGFHEREVSGDKGLQMTFEARSPPLWEHGARGVLFAAVGRISLVNPLQEEIRRESLASIGAGIGWSWKDKVNMRLEAGLVLDGVNPEREDGTRSGDERVHFNLTYRFR